MGAIDRASTPPPSAPPIKASIASSRNPAIFTRPFHSLYCFAIVANDGCQLRYLILFLFLHLVVEFFRIVSLRGKTNRQI